MTNPKLTGAFHSLCTYSGALSLEQVAAVVLHAQRDIAVGEACSGANSVEVIQRYGRWLALVTEALRDTDRTVLDVTDPKRITKLGTIRETSELDALLDA